LGLSERLDNIVASGCVVESDDDFYKDFNAAVFEYLKQNLKLSIKQWALGNHISVKLELRNPDSEQYELITEANT